MGKHYDFQKVAAGVIAAAARPEGLAASNAGIIDLGGLTIVFDSSNSPASGLELREAAAVWTGRSPDILINSHWHNDHIFGNEHFADATIISTAETRQAIDTMVAPGMAEMGNDVTLTRPNLTFADALTFYGSDGEAQLLCWGGGHTASDSFLYLPASGVVFSADLVFNGYHPFIGHGDPDNLIAILGRISQLEPRVCIPGHGAVGGPEIIDGFRHYLQVMKGKVAEFKAAGGSLDAVAALPIPDEFNHYINFGTMYENTVQKLYESI